MEGRELRVSELVTLESGAFIGQSDSLCLRLLGYQQSINRGVLRSGSITPRMTLGLMRIAKPSEWL